MILIAALDNSDGLLFNQRRQSQDRLLRQHILALIGPEKLFLNEYSADLFATEAKPEQLHISEHFLTEAGPGQYCLIENVSVQDYKDKVEKIIIFRWNRDYPADFYFDIDLQQNWQLESSADFVGSSHDKITEETYTRKG